MIISSVSLSCEKEKRGISKKIKNFRQIKAEQVAEKMVMNLLSKKKGVSYLYYEDFLKTEIFE